MTKWNRRSFVWTSALAAAGIGLYSGCKRATENPSTESAHRFNLSLAQWSLHRTLQGGQMDHLDFAGKAATAFGIYAVEYVNTFFKAKAEDAAYLALMNQRAADHGVRQLLIMVDGEGGLAEPDENKRKEAVIQHHKWVHAAKTLGCHSIRVNAYGQSDDPRALHLAAVEGLGALATYAKPAGINVIVENHGGMSSDGQWLSGVMKEINLPNCGTLPDFGNFCLEKKTDASGTEQCIRSYDRYEGVAQLMPFAKAVSAKSYDFDPMGNETTIDFAKMMDIIRQSSYTGYIGIEYEGSRLDEESGILATRNLLQRLIR